MEMWNLPEGWEWKSLPAICNINPSRPRIQLSDDAPTSFIPMQAVYDVEGKIVDMQTRPFREVKRGYTYFEENDVLFAKITPSMENGKTTIARGLINGFGFGTTEFHVFHPHENILPEWIYYYIRRKSFRMEAKSQFRGAVGQQRVPDDFLKSYSIPIPYPDEPAHSLEAQWRIVARLESLLSEVKEIRGLQEKLSKDIESLSTAILTEVFVENGQELPKQWDWMPLEYLVSDTPRRNPSAVIPEKTFQYVDISAIDNKRRIINLERVKSIIGKNSPSRARKVINTNDVIFATTRHYLKNIALIPLELDDNICSTGFCVLKPKLDVTIPEYIYFACQSDATIQQLNPKQRGANYPAVTDRDVFSVMIPVPFHEDRNRSLLFQRQVVNKLKFAYQEISASRIGLDDNAELIAQLEQSFLAQAFQGTL